MEKRNRKEKTYRLIDEGIRNAYLDGIKEEGRILTEKEIAQRIGVTDRTIRNHLDHIRLGTRSWPFRVFVNDVLLGLVDRAKAGDTSAVKLYFMIVFNWNDKREPELLDESNESQLQEWLSQGREILKSLKNEGKEEDNSKLKNK